MEYVESGDDHKNLPIQLLSALSFRYKDQGRRKAEAIFVPKGVQLNSKKIETLVTETWGLSMPNMIISCVRLCLSPADPFFLLKSHPPFKTLTLSNFLLSIAHHRESLRSNSGLASIA